MSTDAIVTEAIAATDGLLIVDCWATWCGPCKMVSRYYERRGLLAPPARSDAGYRQFTADDVWRLAFIRRAKALGFTLTEIGELLSGERDDRANRSVLDVLAAAQAKLVAVEGEIDQLRRRRDQLARLVQTCETGNPEECVDLSAS
jgi:DNA-binding transcriptional MerR regulator